MNIITASLIWIFVISMLLAFVRGAGEQRRRPAWFSIRASDRFYGRHPNLMAAVMLFIFAVVLYFAYGIDSQNTASLYWQMAVTRGAT